MHPRPKSGDLLLFMASVSEALESPAPKNNLKRLTSYDTAQSASQ